MARGMPVQHPGGRYIQPGSPPCIMSISPTSGKVGVAVVAIIRGGGFNSDSQVKVDGTADPLTTFVSDTELRADFPGALTAGVHTVTVDTDGMLSNGVTYPVAP